MNKENCNSETFFKRSVENHYGVVYNKFQNKPNKILVILLNFNGRSCTRNHCNWFWKCEVMLGNGMIYKWRQNTQLPVSY